MVSCVFEKVLKFNGYLLSFENQKEEYTFEFYGIEKPKVGDKILIHKNLLDKTANSFTQPYAFELNKNVEPKKVNEKDDPEFIVLRLNNKNYVLKRIYG